MTKSEKEPGTGKSQGERVSCSAISEGDMGSELRKSVQKDPWKLSPPSVLFHINIYNG